MHKLLILIIVLLAAFFASDSLVAEGVLHGVAFKAGLSVEQTKFSANSSE